MADVSKVPYITKELQFADLKVSQTYDGIYNYLQITLRDFNEVFAIENHFKDPNYSVLFEVNKDVTFPASYSSYSNYIKFTYPGDSSPTSNGESIGIQKNAINMHKGEIWMITSNFPRKSSLRYVGSLWSGSILKDSKYAYAVRDNGKTIKSIVKDGKVLTMGKIQLGSFDEYIDVHTINFVESGPISWSQTSTERNYDTKIKSDRFNDLWFTFAIDDEQPQEFRPTLTEQEQQVTFGDKTFNFKYSYKLINSYQSTYQISIYLFTTNVKITTFKAYVGKPNL